jgi:signal transduction histidine kinase
MSNLPTESQHGYKPAPKLWRFWRELLFKPFVPLAEDQYDLAEITAFLALMMLVFAASLGLLMSEANRAIPVLLARVGVIALSAVLYLLARTRHFRIAGSGLIGTIYVALWVAVLAAERPQVILMVVYGLFTLVQIGTSLLTHWRWVLGLGLLNLVGLLVVTQRPNFPIFTEGFGELYISAVAINAQVLLLVLAVVWQRNRYQARQAQQFQESMQQIQVANQVLIAANQIAQDNIRMKSNFIASVSHELRTPLNAIVGYTGLLTQDFEGDQHISTEQRSMLSSVRSNSERLLNLINDMLNLAKIEAGQLTLLPEKVRMTNLIRDIRDVIDVLAAEKNLTFDITSAPEVPTHLYADKERLLQICINLLSNAVKFTHQGGVRMDFTVDQGFLCVRCSDTGIGIPPEAQALVFEEFRQVEGPARRKYGGTGLGLSIVKKLSEMMGGRVQLQSAVNQGTTITIWLNVLPTFDSENQGRPLADAIDATPIKRPSS